MTLAGWGFATATACYGALFLLLLVSRQRTRYGVAALFASAATVGWGVVGALSLDRSFPLLFVSGVADIGRLFAWSCLPWLLLRASARSSFRGFPFAAAGILGSLIVVPLAAVLLPVRSPALQYALLGQLIPCLWVVASLIGLGLTERLYRTAAVERKRAVVVLCVALGAMFLIDFLVFTDALLFRRVGSSIGEYKSFVFALLAAPLAVGLARTPERAMRLHVSRDAVAGSAVLLFGGLYLLLVSAAGFLVRRAEFAAAGLLEILSALVAALALAALIVSRRLRSRLRVTLSKHLFSYKYDYRKEWLAFTRTLADDSLDTPAAIVNGLTGIVESSTGVLWRLRPDGGAECLHQQNVTGHESAPSRSLQSLSSFLQSTRWLVDLDEFRRQPERYAGLELSDALVGDPTAWLVVPLPLRDSVIGFVLIGRSPVLRRIDWEDRDLLKSAGQQAAGLLALHVAKLELADARQFEAFNRTSAYVVHDLKNILGQQSLIVANAARHRHNPEFIDDVVATIENSVTRMRALLEQLEDRTRPADAERVNLVDLLDAVVSARRGSLPEPTVTCDPTTSYVLADRARLTRVIGHLVQNAQEATPAEGSVRLMLREDGGLAVIEVVDTGSGMSRDFVRDELFRPFRSTKGLTGMGIGAHEAREYVRELGGELDVASEEDHGSTFVVRLPLDSRSDMASPSGAGRLSARSGGGG